MRFMIMHGTTPSINHLPARTERHEAEAEVNRMEAIRLKRNEEAANNAWKERGDAFMRPRHDEEAYWIKEIE